MTMIISCFASFAVFTHKVRFISTYFKTPYDPYYCVTTIN
jgi:hypothetical protein